MTVLAEIDSILCEALHVELQYSETEYIETNYYEEMTEIMTDTMPNMKRYGFVILHYVAYEMTVECVSLLLENFSGYDIHIAVVDNASKNKSGHKLADLYKNENRVTVILNEENSGFARGNNLGYDYLKDHYSPNYIIVMNNDVLADQKEFLDLIDEVYAEDPFAVLGPDIYSPKAQMHQNPWRLAGYTEEELAQAYDEGSRYLKHFFYLYYRHHTLGKIKRIFIKDPVAEPLDYTKKLDTAVLHGACFIFSKDFIEAREYCFNPATFLYMEEEILHYECQRDGLRMIYDPRLKVQHLEDISTNASMRTRYKREKNKTLEVHKSMEVLKAIMEKDS